jgi:hypothetical protein
MSATTVRIRLVGITMSSFPDSADKDLSSFASQERRQSAAAVA